VGIFNTANSTQLNATRDTITNNFYSAINLLGVSLILVGVAVIIGILRSGFGV
jgi:uncharacterized membrane protein YkgB